MSAKQYSHRNGETEPPTVAGKYDFFGKRYGHHLGAKSRELVVVDSFGVLGVMEAYPVGFEHYEGRWWGPVEVPEAVQA